MNHGSRKAIVAAFLANLGIALAKFVGFAITRSAGMLAEAVHSLADTGNQALLMLGGRRAGRRSDPEHPFGYGRERYFWSFVVALVLFSMGGLFALYEGVSKLRHPHEVDNLVVAIVILLFAIALEGFSLRTAVREAGALRKPGEGWIEFIRHSKSPELPVVLLEDAGAEIGLLFALFGVLMAHFTGEPRWDAVGSIAIGLLLVVIALSLAVEMKGLLIGESASDDDVARIRRAVESSPDVLGIIHLRTQHLSPDDLLVAAKLEFRHSLDLATLARRIDGTERAIRAAVPSARLVYIEPDIRHAAPDLAVSGGTVSGDTGEG